ncbi:hypothetical protein RO3G_17025 [Rhizopus delemar RA 99-880]|uniref:Uncharacterized protein n=1 Tax=Rhizopus delemar (strain RA 99-880 / ATCC MYA-4621 / FGSC 9543 / NRRL 43880) TaxID=246409 RepID=I1CUT8_RHIO9|nr:hypothetical protein RO3G_17025 [Rhizopus delemar RA 99-880]|eukprot:EIE92218.1 hypothetical protein RO3G_17025 [Rhizopus delemar RA 99-880]
MLLFNAPVSRKRQKLLDTEISIRLRKAFALKNDYLDYQKHIRNLKEEGYSIIGYARKSKGKEEEEARLRLLQKMIDSLKNRSLVDQVFISICSGALSPIPSRD